MRIEVTQFLRPDGRKSLIWLDDCPDDLGPLVRDIEAKGCMLTAEHLTTGEVSFAIQGDEADVAIEVCPNGPGTREALYRLLRSFPDAWIEYEKALLEIEQEEL